MKQKSYEGFVLEILVNVSELIAPICEQYGLIPNPSLTTITSKNSLKQCIDDDIDDESVSLLSILYMNKVREDGFWFAWQLQFGWVHLAFAGDNHAHIPLPTLNSLSAIEHAQYIVQTLVSCLNGDFIIETACTNKGPIGMQVIGIHPGDAIYQSDKFPSGRQLKNYTVKRYSNKLHTSNVAPKSLSDKIDSLNIDESEDTEASWWGWAYDDEEYDTIGTPDNAPSAWWYFLLWLALWLPLLWLATTYKYLHWMIEDTVAQIFIPVILGYAAIVVADMSSEKISWLSPLLRKLEPFTINPIVKLCKVIFKIGMPLYSNAHRAMLSLFVISQSILSLQYFYDNATEKTTNHILTFQEMATLHPIVWLYPILQLTALIAFITKRYYAMYLSIVTYVVIQYWASFGGIYTDNYPTLHGWQSAADNALTVVVVGLSFFSIYAAYKVLEPLLKYLRNNTKRSYTKVIPELVNPSVISEKSLKIWA